MNFILYREALSGFLFLPNFNSYDTAFRRIDDVWGGYIFQKLAQKKHQAISYGQPIVEHVTKINAIADTDEERAMYKYEDEFIETVDNAIKEMHCTANNSYSALYEEFVKYFEYWRGTSFDRAPFKNLSPAMQWWLDAWRKYEQ